MAKGKASGEATPARPPPTLKKENSTGPGKNQQSILGFFAKRPANVPQSTTCGPLTPKVNVNGTSKPAFTKTSSTKNITPVPSSDAIDPPSDDEMEDISAEVHNGLPSPLTPAKTNVLQAGKSNAATDFSSPSRKVNIKSFVVQRMTTN